ncbi:DNA polymerase III beta subunit [hydrothermal vent metagenome]|uniref:DNA polymerase III beta subunit n=1 Tax=hydrothermal vent metagenome TaxID=652676 RepID=A0A1W1CRJ6_9ZZZZ
MKIQLSIEEIKNPLQNIIGVVEKKQTLPILSHILFQFKNKNLTLSATDMEIEIKTITSVSTDVETSFTIYAKTLIDIIKNLSNETIINLETSEKNISLKIEKNIFNLNSLTPKDFPVLPEITNKWNVDLNKKELKFLLDKISFSMGNQDIRSYLNGILLKIDNNKITLVATDGHRLAIGFKNQTNDIGEDRSIIIPRKTISELLKILNNDTGDNNVNLTISENYIIVNANNEIILKSRLIDSSFPDYQQVVPTELNNPIIINRNEFLTCLHQAAVFIDERTKSVKLIFEQNTLKIQTKSENGRADIELTTQTTLDDILEVGFNINYLIQSLEKLDSDNVKFIMPNKDSSCLIVNEDDVSIKYIIMPLKL